MSLEILAEQMFTQPAGQLGIVALVSSATDNEQVFETLLNFVAHGLTAMGKDFSDFLDDDFLDEINEKLTYVGYQLKFDVIPYDMYAIVHYCSIDSQNHFKLNRFHPFRLMEGMSEIPPAYQDYFNNCSYLHQVIANCRVDDGMMLFRFYPVNVIAQNNALLHAPSPGAQSNVSESAAI